MLMISGLAVHLTTLVFKIERTLSKASPRAPRFEGRLKKLRWWLEHMEKRMTTDLSEAQQQRGPEKAMLEQVEEYQQEVLKERYAQRQSSASLPSSQHTTSPLFLPFLGVRIAQWTPSWKLPWVVCSG